MSVSSDSVAWTGCFNRLAEAPFTPGNRGMLEPLESVVRVETGVAIVAVGRVCTCGGPFVAGRALAAAMF